MHLRHLRGGIPATNSVEGVPSVTGREIPSAATKATPGWLGLVRQLLGYIADGPQDRASDNFTCCHTAQTMTSISAGHIILTPTQPVGSGRPQRGSNPGPPDKESRALPTEQPHPALPCQK